MDDPDGEIEDDDAPDGEDLAIELIDKGEYELVQLVSIASSSTSSITSLSFAEYTSDSFVLDGESDIDIFSVVATEDEVLEQGLTDDDLGDDKLEVDVVTDNEDELVDKGVFVWKALDVLRSTNLYCEGICHEPCTFTGQSLGCKHRSYPDTGCWDCSHSSYRSTRSILSSP